MRSLAASLDAGLAAQIKMAPKKKPKTQVTLGVEQFTLLKKPLDHLGKQIDVTGDFWQGRMTSEERETV